MKKVAVAVLVLGVLSGSGYWYYRYSRKPAPPTVTTSPVVRGDIVETVSATGALQAVTTVQVGTQVSGTILSLGADYNALVRKGQVIARLDPSLFQTQVEQARANLLRAQADLERLRVALSDAQSKLGRARELSSRQLIPRSELETAEVDVQSAQAQLRSQEAQITQARASLNQSQVNLEHTVIKAPIDGLVISRNVDVGQTVAASMQAPTLFVLAADLTKMQVLANLDESDVGRIRPRQAVTFRVDAYPNDTFRGTVSQVRLDPKVQQNVVTYATVIDVPNNDLRLKPGMTANVNVEIARATHVLRIPNSALRFRPSDNVFAALGQAPPEPQSRGGVAGSGRRGPGSATAAAGSYDGAEAAPAQAPAPNAGARVETSAGSAPVSSATGVPPSGRDQDVRGENAATPRGASARAEQTGAAGADRRARQQPAPTGGTAAATTIDALFAPLPRTESAGRAWLYVDHQLRPVRLRLGISDGQSTELVDGDLAEGTELVTNVTVAGQSTRPAASAFPGFGQPARGGFPGGGFPGPGGGGSRGGGGGR